MTNKQAEELVPEKNEFAVKGDDDEMELAVKGDGDETEIAMPFVCGYCQRQFNQISQYCLHFQEHESSLAHLFHICGDWVTSEKIVVSCVKCKSAFPSICMLHSHLLVCSRAGSYCYDHKRSVAFPVDDISTIIDSRTEEAREIFNTQTKDEDQILQNKPTNEGSYLNENMQKKTLIVQVQTNCKSKPKSVPVAQVKKIKPRRGRPRKAKKCLKIYEGHENTLDTETCVMKQEDVEIDNTQTSEEILLKHYDIPENVIVVKEEDINESDICDRFNSDIKQSVKHKEHSDSDDSNIEIAEKSQERNVAHKSKTNKLSILRKTVTAKRQRDNIDKLKQDLSPVKIKKKKVYECHICKKVCADKGRLTHHLFSHSDVRNFQCNICSVSYKYPYHLKVHMRSHNAVKPFYCELCGEGFIELTRLKAHRIHKHTTDKKHKCSKCGVGFKFKAGLTRHFLNHSEEKLHQCDICGQQFSRKYYLVQHMWIHTNTRRFECNVDGCRRKFFTNYQLQCHLKIHSGERPYKCSSCTAAFIQRKELRRHMKKLHGLNLDSIMGEAQTVKCEDID